MNGTFYTKTQTDFRYLGPLDQNYTVGSQNGSSYTTLIYQNLKIGNSYTFPTSTFYGKVLLNNGDTTFTIGKYNSANEDSFSPLNIYKYSIFLQEGIFKRWG